MLRCRVFFVKLSMLFCYADCMWKAVRMMMALEQGCDSDA